MGASLACAVVAGMLQDNLLSHVFITENLACITFGQPLSAIASLEKLFLERDYLKKCFHHIYVSDDALPMLLMHSTFEQNTVSYTLLDARDYICYIELKYRQCSYVIIPYRGLLLCACDEKVS